MMLRWLVSNYLRQAAQEQILQSASRAATRSRQPPSTPEVLPELPPCAAVVLFATTVEADGLVNRLKQARSKECASYHEHAGMLAGHSLVIAEAGGGSATVSRVSEDLIATLRPPWIVSAGFAAALDDRFRRGDILMAEQVLDEQQAPLTIGLSIDPEIVAATPGLHVGRLLTVDRLIRKPREKRRLAETHQCLACDMETMVIAEACRQQRVRFLSVRVISDLVDDELPSEIANLMDQKTLAGKLGAVTGAVLKRPSSVKQMWQLQERAAGLSDRLAKFLIGVVPQLAASRDN